VNDIIAACVPCFVFLVVNCLFANATNFRMFFLFFVKAYGESVLHVTTTNVLFSKPTRPTLLLRRYTRNSEVRASYKKLLTPIFLILQISESLIFGS
jgi:hypothetical protein